jgi:hypothetical protein
VHKLRWGTNNGEDTRSYFLIMYALLATTTTVKCRTPTPAPARSTHLIRNGLFHPCPCTRTQTLIPPPSLFGQVHSFSILLPLVFHHYPSGMTQTQDPFASTASLDVNPFDDPFADQDSVNKPSQYSHELAASRVADLDRRERDLESRERELHKKAETIRKHGRNNWPPGDYPLRSIRRPESIHTHIRP